MIRTNKGYTLLESLFALIIVLLFVHLFYLFFVWKTWNAPLDEVLERVEHEMFWIEVDEWIREAVDVQISTSNRRLQVQTAEGNYDIHLHNQNVRMQKNGRGHVPLLTKVEHLTFQRNEDTITYAVTWKSGRTIEGAWAYVE